MILTDGTQKHAAIPTYLDDANLEQLVRWRGTEEKGTDGATLVREWYET